MRKLSQRATANRLTLGDGAPVSLAALYGAFLKASLFSFGGGLLLWTRRILVEEHRWISDHEFADTLSLCQLLPGANFANLSVCIGARFRGVPGAAAAFLGLTLVPLILALVLGILFLQIADLPVVRRVLGGAAAVGAGMVLATAIRLLLLHRRRPLALLIAALAFTGVVVVKLPLPVVLFGLAPFSIAANWLARETAE
jgi:chromate transporter